MCFMLLVSSPINFIDDHERRWAYGCVFALLSYRILNLFDGDNYLDFPEVYQDPEFSTSFGWTSG